MLLVHDGNPGTEGAVDYDWRDYGRRPAPRGGYDAGYDLEFGNWGARSGLDTPGRRGFAAYDRPFRAERSQWGFSSGIRPEFRRSHEPGPRYGREYRGSYGSDYRRDYRRDYDRDFGGWGMTGLHRQMMQHRGEGFDYAGDYHRTHPIHPEELNRGSPRGGRRPWWSSAPGWRG